MKSKISFSGVALLASLCLTGILFGCSANESSNSDETVSTPGESRPAVPRQAARLLVEAREHLKQGRFRNALVVADSAERAAPEGADTSPIYFFRGRVFTQLRQYEHAKAAFEKAVELRPDYRGGWYQLGNLAFHRGKYREAVEYYQTERKHHGDHARILYQMGRCYTHLGRRDSARKAFERATTLDSTFARAYMELSELEEEEGNFEQALSFARQALGTPSANTESRYQYGSLLFQMGRVEKALDPLRHVIAEDSSHRGAHYYLGQALARQGHSEEAEEYLEKADRLRTLDKEIEQLEREAELYSRQPKRWMELGSTLRRAGRIEEAIKAYTIAQTLEPQNQRIRDTLAQLRQMR
jgi:tetratricopeptide (TPR) repeat protein